jgi:hypothetical protein
MNDSRCEPNAAEYSSSVASTSLSARVTSARPAAVRRRRARPAVGRILRSLQQTPGLQLARDLTGHHGVGSSLLGKLSLGEGMIIMIN